MKRRLCLLALSVTLIGASAVRADVGSNRPKLMELVKALQAGSAQLADNQAKIDTKIAALAETIRLARIEASRDGGAHKPPPPAKK